MSSVFEKFFKEGEMNMESTSSIFTKEELEQMPKKYDAVIAKVKKLGLKTDFLTMMSLSKMEDCNED